VRELLRARFVAAADEVWRLQRGSDADCVFFQRAVNGGQRITDRGTRQGSWVLAPDGTLLGHVNSRESHDVRAMMDAALVRWAELPESARALPAGVELDPAHRWEDSWPADGLVLVRIARELGPEPVEEMLAGERAPAWNRDFAWFSAAEIAAEVPPNVRPGSSFELPLVARRLARFHLVDNVHGQTLPYADVEVRSARLAAHATARVGSQLVLVLEGASEALAEGPWLGGESLWKPSGEHAHGMETRLGGRAVLDLETRRFLQFELVAVGRRFGRTDNDGRWRDPAPGRVAFHFALAPPEPRVAPTFVAVYDAPWIEAPAVGTWIDSPAECGLEGN